MTTKRILAAAALVSLMICPVALQAASTDSGTPNRGPDGRIRPTTNPHPKAYAWETMAEHLEKLEKANSLRNDLRAKFPLPLSVAVRVPDGSIKIDGDLDEKVWQEAPVITGFRETSKDPDINGQVAKEQTRIRLLWDSKYLYIGAQCDDNYITAQERTHDGQVWNDDAVEVFLNPSGDEMSYLDFEVNPLGTWYDASVADYRPEVDWRSNGKHLNMEKAASSFNTKDSKWAVKVDGTIHTDQPTPAHVKPDKGWTAEIAIAWTDIDRGTNVIHSGPPLEGDLWRMNFGHINVAEDSENNVSSAWNPTGTWFHRPWMFGRVVFINGDTTPGEAADTSAAKPAKGRHKHKKSAAGDNSDASATQPAPDESDK